MVYDAPDGLVRLRRGRDGAPIQSNSRDVWAAITLDGTGLQVSFESSGKNYPVSGCYADYTALLAANIGPDAYVFALTAGGFVEAVNMTACSLL